MSKSDPQENAATGQTLMAFALDDELRDRVLALVEEVRAADHPKARSRELAATISELTQAGLHYYFLRPLQDAEVGFFHLNTARIGLASAGKSLPLVVRNVMKSLTDEQLLSIAESIADMLVEMDDAENAEVEAPE